MDKKAILLTTTFVLFNVIVLIGQSLNPTSSISAAGSVDTFKGGYTFSYATSGTPWTGALISFGGFQYNNYDTQISSDYGPNGGNHISFRTKNGDANTWNTWNELATRGTNNFVGNQSISTNLGIGVINPQAGIDIFKSYDLTTTKAIKLMYQGSWGTPQYASNYRFIDISSTEEGNVLALNAYGMGIGFNPPPYSSPDKLYINGNVGIGLSDIGLQTKLHVKESGASNGVWRGRIVASGDQNAIVMGEYNGKAWLGAHNSQLNGWSDLIMQADGGNIGIGTSLAPTEKLEVVGNGKFSIANAKLYGGTNADRLIISNNTTTAYCVYNGSTHATSANNIDIVTTTGKIGLFTNAIERVSVLNNGNVGIGTTTPDTKLAVNGTIHSKEVKVDLLSPMVPDYVFARDYKLKTLEEVEDFIKKNNHLPEIPSAKEFEENGLMLAEMNMSLLKKMEELTLYMIELKNENQKQNEKITVLENKLKNKR